VAGLNQPVEILRDRWGINHIYAKNEHDLFLAQGYSVARDRLFQLELWRRQATGTVAEILGRRELKRDIGARLHIFRGNLTQELNWYHPHGEEIVTAFVRGINAYIDEVLLDPSRLPPEFKLLGIKPGKWTPAVVISRHNGLLGNAVEELRIAQAVKILGVEAVSTLSQFYGSPVLNFDPAVDLSLINGSVLELYNAFRGPIEFIPQDVRAAYQNDEPQLEQPARATQGILSMDLGRSQEDIGSNNWVVSGRLTQSGRPLLANDPHRAQGAPSLRYWVHLVAPGWNVIGSGEPVLPGVSIGHNEFGAWGLTIFGTDTEDLYVYETNPANPSQYKYRGAWETMQVVKDTIPVKGEVPVAVELKYTRHGPVLYEDPGHHKAYALRAAWMEMGSAPYLASLRMDQARTWEDFREACSYSRIPAENMVWADVTGTIGYQAVAIAPVRPNWSGLVPVPGDGRYEWDGFLPIKGLPHVVNPEKGYYVTANNYQFPPGYPFRGAQHWTAADPYRAARISEFLASGRLHSIADMMQLQNDNLSLPARSLVPLLRDAVVADTDVAKARDTLITWNYVLDKESVAAGIYEMWQRRIMANIRDLLVPKEARPIFTALSMTKVIDWLQTPDGRFGEDPVAGREKLLTTSLAEALAQLTKTLGPDMRKWQYGQEKYHYALIYHPLTAVLKPDLRSQFDVGPVPRGGDSYTVTATGSTDNQTAGGSFKMIVDIGEWDNSVGLNNPGQSGDPRSAHYRDLFELWSRGLYFPILYSRSKIESVTDRSVILQQ
jgi:penicillin amidase